MKAQTKVAGQNQAITNAGTAWAIMATSAMKKFIRRIKKNRKCHKFAFDEFREWAIATGNLAEPISKNAWGALPILACKMGMIKPTKEISVSSRPDSHSRILRVWKPA